MEIRYSSSNIEGLCNNEKELKRKYGDIVAKKMKTTLNFLKNADNLLDIKNIPSFNLHMLKGDRAGTLSIYLGKTTGIRLLIEAIKDNEEITTNFSNLNEYKEIKIIMIMEVSKHYE